MAKKEKSKFWLIRMHQIKIFHIFVPNLSMWSQNSFRSESKAYLGSRQLKKKTDFRVKNVFIWCIFGIEKVKETEKLD